MKVKIESANTRFGTTTIIGKVDGLPVVAQVPLISGDEFTNDEVGLKRLAIQLAVAAGQGGASNSLEIPEHEEMEISMNEVEEERKKVEAASRKPVVSGNITTTTSTGTTVTPTPNPAPSFKRGGRVDE